MWDAYALITTPLLRSKFPRVEADLDAWHTIFERAGRSRTADHQQYMWEAPRTPWYHNDVIGMLAFWVWGLVGFLISYVAETGRTRLQAFFSGWVFVILGFWWYRLAGGAWLASFQPTTLPGPLEEEDEIEETPPTGDAEQGHQAGTGATTGGATTGWWPEVGHGGGWP